MNPRTRALVTVGIVMSLMTLLFVIIFIRHQNKALETYIGLLKSNQQQQMEMMLENISKSYEARIKSLYKDRKNIIDAFAGKDHDKLLEAAIPIFAILKKENPFFRAIFFINPDNTAFLRLPGIASNGDDVTELSPLTAETNKTKKMLSGFEIVKIGLSYRITYPVFEDEEYAGVMGFGIGTEMFTKNTFENKQTRLAGKEEATKSNKIFSAVVYPKDNIKLIPHTNFNLKLCGDCAVVAEKGTLFTKLPENFNLKESFQRIKIDNTNYAFIHSAQFNNFKGENIARLVSLIDIDSSIKETRSLIKNTIIGAIVLFILVFLVVYFNFTTLFSKIAQLTASLEEYNKKLESMVQRRTEKLKKEAIAKKEMEQELRIIFRTIPDPIVVYNLEGKATAVNDAFVKTFGWEFEELRQRIVPFVPEEEKRATLDTIEKIYRSGTAETLETKRLTKDGKLLDIIVSAAAIKDIKGNNTGIVVILKDISEKKIHESQMRQAQKMEAIGTLAGGIAHDFNNILSGIFGYAQLAEIHINNPEKAKDKIQQLLVGARRASELVQQILTVSRHSKQEKKPVVLFLIVNEALKFLRSTIPVTIKIEKNLETREKIFADPIQVHQVVMNLCANAAQAMEKEGGILRVSLTEETVSLKESMLYQETPPGKYIRLEVTDTGCGIDGETLKKIFDPYFTTKKAGKGTGLGLAMVEGIVKKHGGVVSVSSKLNQGSKFEVFWPVMDKQKNVAANDIKRKSAAGGSAHIMLVDDEVSILKTSQMMLEKKGYSVSAYQDGQDALKAFEQNPDAFDLIISDTTMPVITGDKLATKIFEIKTDMPLIICTGFSELMNEEKAKEMGISSFIMKPYLIDDLDEQIKSALKKTKKGHKKE